MPRGSDADLYPEEVAAGLDVTTLWEKFEGFVAEAALLRRRFDEEAAAAAGTGLSSGGCEILIGFEIEWIRSPQSAELVREVLDRQQRQGHGQEKWDFDFFIGSVHHVRGVPIDFDAEMYARAIEVCRGGKHDGNGNGDRSDTEEEALFADYFDAQHEMLLTLKPPVVGHFDLIRLLSEDPDRAMQGWAGGRVWEKIVRNLEVVKGYGGLLELNSSALRKGLREPYPRREICEAWIGMRGGFVMSDDSHGIEQVGTCYPKLLQWTKEVGMHEICYLTKGRGGIVTKKIGIAELEKEPFWDT